MNKRLLALWMVIFITLGANSSMSEINFYSGELCPSFYSDELNQLYYIKTEKEGCFVYRIDLAQNKAESVFKQKSADSDISIGSNEICFRHVYYSTLSGEIGPHRYFTTSIYKNGRLNWKPRSGIQVYYRQKEVESYYFVNDKLFMTYEPTGGDRTEIPYQSSLFVIDQNTTRKVCEADNAIFVQCSTGFLLWPSDQIAIPDNVLFYDGKNETLIAVPEKIEHIDWSNFIAYDSVLYYSSDNQVLRFNENTKEKELIKEVTSTPHLCFSDGVLYIYDCDDKKVYVYDPVFKCIEKEYDIPRETIPKYGVSAFFENKLVVSERNGLFSYDLGLGIIEEIQIIK